METAAATEVANVTQATAGAEASSEAPNDEKPAEEKKDGEEVAPEKKKKRKKNKKRKKKKGGAGEDTGEQMSLAAADFVFTGGESSFTPSKL